MDITIGKTSGFCMGVNLAIEKAKKMLNENNKKDLIYCLGEIVHNKQVVKSLEDKNMITVNNIEEIPDNSFVIFRAHGEAESVYERAKEKKLKIIDATCGKVKVIHHKVVKEKENGAFILIIGKKSHPEIIGTKGFSGKNSYVIESCDDILDAYIKFEESEINDVYVCSQTTFSNTEFEKIVKEIEDNFYEANIKIDNTICDATNLRQVETLKLSKEFHKMIIIGGKNSSNTKELANIAKENCKDVYLVETSDDLNNYNNISKEDKIAIMAGASTPKESIDDIVNYLESL